MTCLEGKRPSVLKKWSKIKIYQTILVGLLKVCLPDSLICDFTFVNKVANQDLKMEKVCVKILFDMAFIMDLKSKSKPEKFA